MNEMYGYLLEAALEQTNLENVRLQKQLKRLKRTIFVSNLVMISGFIFACKTAVKAYEEASNANEEAFDARKKYAKEILNDCEHLTKDSE